MATTKPTKVTKIEFDTLSNRVISCALEVHRHLGPGLLESAYEHALAHELMNQNIAFRQQQALPIHYKQTGLLINFNTRLLKQGIKRMVL